MGGMAAQIPIKDDPAANDAAMAKVRADKEREATDGHDGTWVAHPGAGADREGDLRPASCRRRTRSRASARTCTSTAADLLAVPERRHHRGRPAPQHHVGDRTISRRGCAGTGCVPLYNLMEDAATAEISRAQVWQWLTPRRASQGRASHRPPAVREHHRRSALQAARRQRRRRLRLRHLRFRRQAVRGLDLRGGVPGVPDPAGLRVDRRRLVACQADTRPIRHGKAWPCHPRVCLQQTKWSANKRRRGFGMPRPSLGMTE